MQHFLNVSCSVTGRAWQERCSLAQNHMAMAMAQHHGIPEILARILAGRGIDVTQAPDFINPTLRRLMPDPSSFQDMDKAAARLVRAIEQREQIAIFGDYDVDGACSLAMLMDFFAAFGLTPRPYVPDRLLEGYGPNVPAMQRLVREGASLIITVDCGAVSDAPISAAHKEGAQVIVLDHHQMGNTMPEHAHAIVNPNRPDDISGHGFLCAAGVVFMTLAAVLRQLRVEGKQKTLPDLLNFLDLVALATVCDVVPLMGVNRAFVAKGLQVARLKHRCGLAALTKAARINAPLDAFHFGFILGPRINAGGRIGHGALGAQLLSCKDPQQADILAAQLENLNATRQAMESQQLQEAEAQAIAFLAQDDAAPLILVASHHWHPGIIGLLATRLKEHYHRPTIVLAIAPDGTVTGSARSVKNLDIGALIKRAVAAGLIEKGGGHPMAAGLSLHEAQIEPFRHWCMKEALHGLGKGIFSPPLFLDGILSSSGATLDLLEQLEQAGPFGASHEPPVFALPSHRLIDVREVGQGHLVAALVNREGAKLKTIAFRTMGTNLGHFLLRNQGHLIHASGVLSLNNWHGLNAPQLRLIDAAPT